MDWYPSRCTTARSSDASCWGSAARSARSVHALRQHLSTTRYAYAEPIGLPLWTQATILFYSMHARGCLESDRQRRHETLRRRNRSRARDGMSTSKILGSKQELSAERAPAMEVRTCRLAHEDRLGRSYAGRRNERRPAELGAQSSLPFGRRTVAVGSTAACEGGEPGGAVLLALAAAGEALPRS
jgi:hypothetical protein